MRLRGSGKERGDRRCWGWEKDRAWWDETGNDCEWNVADRWIIAMSLELSPRPLVGAILLEL